MGALGFQAHQAPRVLRRQAWADVLVHLSWRRIWVPSMILGRGFATQGRSADALPGPWGIEVQTSGVC